MLFNDTGTLLTDTSAFLDFIDVAMEDPESVDEGAPAYLFQDAGERGNGYGGDFDGLVQILSEG